MDYAIFSYFKSLVMRNFGIILIFLCCQILMYGQKKARDFKVTTTDKKSIELYRDYLTKGKVVMLKIFFVDCPPCNDIAPQISDLYKKFGSGKENVEFIELSNKGWDFDAAVIGYKIKYDLPCPSVSQDGGSVEASALYSDNFYGPFFGTPTFVVISPNGNVDFDPRGAHKNETIRLLDTSISRALRSIIPPADTSKPVPPTDTTKPVPPTDTTKPKPPVDTVKPIPSPDTIKLTGKLSYANSGLGLADITLTINDKDYKFKTDLQGFFTFILPDTFKNVAITRMKVDYNLSFNEDVSAQDLLIIQKHILAIEPFGDYKRLLAADANGDTDINALDLLEFRKIILGISDKLPNNTPSLYFLFKNANNLIKSLSNPINMDELRAMKDKSFNIEVVKTGNVKE